MKRSLILFIQFCISISLVNGQNSSTVLTEEEFLSIVRSNHPVAKQAGLLADLAAAQLLTIKGNFDPVIAINKNQKTFDGKTYYNYNNAEMVIPTWFGIELYAGIENNFGDYTNREYTLGNTSYAGLSVPLLKDLILDKRRAALQQGRLFKQQSEFEKRTIINDLIYDAYKSYWNWAKDYQVFRSYDTILVLNETRYSLVKISFQNGERAAVDTTEAFVQLLNFQQQREEAWLKFRKSTLELSAFLWHPNNVPAYLTELVIPDTARLKNEINFPQLENVDNWINLISTTHPKLQQIDFKLQALEVERKLKLQNLLPKLDVKYNFLQKGYNSVNFSANQFFENNYKFGVSAIVAIPNRQGIGDYKSSRIKIKSTELDRNFTQLNLENKVRFHFNEVLNLQKQIRIYESLNKNLAHLYNTEMLKFSLGETTLFLLNSRETKMLESQQKLLELKAKLYQAYATLNWATGSFQD